MSTQPVSDFGTLLRRHRRAARLTQEELAERSGISVDAISALERGVSRAPQRATIELLAEALQLSEVERAQLEDAARQLRRNSPAPEDTPLHLVRSDEDEALPTQPGPTPPSAPASLTTPAAPPSPPESVPPQKPVPLPARRQRKQVLLMLGALLVLVVAASSGLSSWQHWWPFGKDKATMTPTPAYVYAQPTHMGGTLTFSMTKFFDVLNVGSWNPWFVNSPAAMELENAFWGSPFIISPSAVLLPDELTEIPTQSNGDVSQDELTVTMRLRPDLKWSDGQPLTADDFAYWLEVMLDPATGSDYTYGYDQIASYQVLDDHTLALRYKQPYSPYLYYLPLAAPRHIWGRIPNKDLSTHNEVNRYLEVTSGPFRIESYTPGQNLTMVPNPHYKSTTLHNSVLTRLVYTAYPDADSLIAAFESGQIDYVEVLGLDEFPKVAGVREARNTQYSASHNLYFNLTNPVLQDLQVRKAIEEAIDRCGIIVEVFQSPCKRLRVDTILPPPSSAYDPTITTYPFDLAQARQDMQIAGWNCASGTCTRNGKPFPALTLVTSNESTVRSRTTELIGQNLEALGIPISLNLYSPGEVFETYANGGLLATGQFDLAIFGNSYGLDNYGNLAVFHSKEIPSANYPDGGNWERLDDPLIDNDLNQALITLDRTQQTYLYEAIQRVLIEKVYVVPLYLHQNITLVSPNIGNQQNNPLGPNLWNIGDWFLIK